MLLNLASVVNAETPGHAVGLHPPLQPGRDARDACRSSTSWWTTRSPITATSSGRRNTTATRRTSNARRLADLAETLKGMDRGGRCGSDPEHRLRGGQAASVPRTARLVRLPVSGAAGPAGRSALRRLHRAVRHRRDGCADRGRAVAPGGRCLTAMLAQRARGILRKAGLRQLPAILGVAAADRRDLCRAEGIPPPAAARHRRRAERQSRCVRWRSRFVWTVLSYGVLTIYDRLGTIYAGHKVSYGRVAFASFCAYALSHNLGFAAVSGAAVRYRLYAHWGLTPMQIAKTVAFCSLTFALGGMVLGGAILFLEPTCDSVLRRASAGRGAVRGRCAAVGDRDRLRHAVAHPRARPSVRPRDRPAGLADGDRAGAAGDRRRRDHRVDLLCAAADRHHI